MLNTALGPQHGGKRIVKYMNCSRVHVVWYGKTVVAR
jgi:glutamate dehydrogenase/leucine dehydrogenase